jgi:hypothetical protein
LAGHWLAPGLTRLEKTLPLHPGEHGFCRWQLIL